MAAIALTSGIGSPSTSRQLRCSAVDAQDAGGGAGASQGAAISARPSPRCCRAVDALAAGGGAGTSQPPGKAAAPAGPSPRCCIAPAGCSAAAGKGTPTGPVMRTRMCRLHCIKFCCSLGSRKSSTRQCGMRSTVAMRAARSLPEGRWGRRGGSYGCGGQRRRHGGVDGAIRGPGASSCPWR